MSEVFALERSVLEGFCRGAGSILLRGFGKDHARIEKPEAGFVTAADLEAEAFLLGAIDEAFPGSAILSEEAGTKNPGAPLRWIIDPLDGTTNYANGIPFFAVSLAVEAQGELRQGVVFNPVSKELFWAEHGGGAWLQDKRLQVGTKSELAEAVLATGDWYRRDPSFSHSWARAGALYRACRALRLTGSVALALAYTACGRFDAVWVEDYNPWDVAAGALLVREAGGVVTDFRGEAVQIGHHGPALLATSPALHGVLAPLLRGGTMDDNSGRCC